MVGTIIAATVTLILVYLVLTKATGFESVATALRTNYVNAVTALQGR